jgi:cytoplasmic iron level regulating protein YaaA (DUF328/UPF0246 family)
MVKKVIKRIVRSFVNLVFTHFLYRVKYYNLEELKNFSFNGYKFDHTLSSDKKYVFIKQD